MDWKEVLGRSEAIMCELLQSCLLGTHIHIEKALPTYIPSVARQMQAMLEGAPKESPRENLKVLAQRGSVGQICTIMHGCRYDHPVRFKQSENQPCYDSLGWHCSENPSLQALSGLPAMHTGKALHQPWKTHTSAVPALNCTTLLWTRGPLRVGAT
jgi:hypothetical protein